MNQYDIFKRYLYLFILPVITFASIMGLFFSDSSNQLNNWVLSIYSIVFSLSWLLLWFANTLKLVEYINLTLVSVIHIIKSHDIIATDMVINGSTHTGSSTYWTPLVFVFIFISLPRKLGLYYALSLWLVIVGIGAYYWNQIPEAGHERLLQYFLSNLIYIIFIFFVRRIMTYYSEKEVMEKMAYYDTLTGIANRRKIYIWLDESLKKKEDFSVILFDIDYFKAVNDKYGHPIGDKVLKKITELTTSNLGSEDFFGRWGGEEFIIVSRNKTEEEVFDLANKIRISIQDHPFEIISGVTASFGFAQYHNQSIELLLEQADKSLYYAKHKGRNRVQNYKDMEL